MRLPRWSNPNLEPAFIGSTAAPRLRGRRHAVLDGVTEMPADGRFIVITVPVVAGFAVVEEIANTWASSNDAD